MRIQYRKIRLNKLNKIRLDLINSIIVEYLSQGYKLTLRQLYYQLVSRDVIPNNVKEYAKLSNLIKEGRMGGIVDWEAIEDRLRVPDIPSCWNDIPEIIQSAEQSFRLDRQLGQKNYIEVLVEKDALSGVLKRVTRPYGIPITINRGYSSVTAMHDIFQRIKDAYDEKENFNQAVILYVGDFDPSGLDMIRDVEDRITDFLVGYGLGNIILTIQPVALTSEQINKYNPPPNPAKRQDPRAKKFIAQYGSSSWEVDALKPEVLHKTLDNNIRKYIDIKTYEAQLQKESSKKQTLQNIYEHLIDKDSEIWKLI